MSAHQSLLILIATKNRPDLLLKTLYQLSLQLSEKDLVIVSDATDKIPDPRIHEFFQNHSSNFQHHKNSTLGLTANRNFSLSIPVAKSFSYWCFFDDDLNIKLDYIQNVRIAISQLDNETAVTGYLNTNIPNSPDWLGFYRKPALKNGILEMPHAVGTWIPVHGYPKFIYQSEHFYGYDELELRDYLLLNSIKLKFVPYLLISHPMHEFATLKYMNKWMVDKIRIQQNIKSMRRNKKSTFQISLFLMRTFSHALLYQLIYGLLHIFHIFFPSLRIILRINRNK